MISEPPDPIPVDLLDREDWRERLRQLPLRALAAFTLRCAKRLEPLVRLGHLKVDAYASGIDIDASSMNDWKAVAIAAVATAYNSTSNNPALAGC